MVKGGDKELIVRLHQQSENLVVESPFNEPLLEFFHNFLVSCAMDGKTHDIYNQDCKNFKDV